jgi:adenylate kinase
MMIVLGTPGAGKSTVLAKATEGFGCKEINYGDLMFDIALKEKFVKNRDELRKLPLEKQKRLQADVAKALEKMEGRIILNTHAIISTDGGYMPGLSETLLRNANIRQLILITAPPKDVIRRRKEDKTRTRDQETEGQIKELIEINKAYLFAYSAISGAPAAVVENADGKLEEAVAKVRKLLEARW